MFQKIFGTHTAKNQFGLLIEELLRWLSLYVIALINQPPSIIGGIILVQVKKLQKQVNASIPGFVNRHALLGAKLSQHRYGRAIDIQVAGMDPQEVYDYILKHADVFRAVGLTTMEDVRDTPTWNHLDVRQTDQAEILIVRP